MAWRVAECIKELLAEVDQMAPDRSKISDGTIGNAAHAARDSDHNPWIRDGDVGVVSAVDITDDPAHGCDATALAEHFRALGLAGDKRIKYVIRNRRICNGAIENWKWRPYNGANPHTHHVHLSVSSDKRYYDSEATWQLEDDMPTAEEILNAKVITIPGQDDKKSLADMVRVLSQARLDERARDAETVARDAALLAALQSASGGVLDAKLIQQAAELGASTALRKLGQAALNS